jgi:3-hydroxybutyryl-CoA dehydratase
MTMVVGETAISKRVFSQQDFDLFAALSGDDNPIHVDPEFSARTKFSRTVAHGMLLYTTICGVLDSRWPGAWQIEQELVFPNPTYVDEQVTVCLEVTQVETEQRMAWLSTTIVKPDGTMGCEGKTVVQLPEEE